jgi:hypothetical protein
MGKINARSGTDLMRISHQLVYKQLVTSSWRIHPPKREYNAFHFLLAGLP